MPQRIAPIVGGETYHIFNRGVDKRDIFLDKGDYLRFYQSLTLFNSEEAVVNFDSALVQVKNGVMSQSKLVEVYAYCLLPNHYHLLLKSLSDGGASEFMRRISLGYTSYFNQKYERSGVLFQGQFKRTNVESDSQYQYLFAYVNENHFVHNLEISREICHSSSLHYQGVAKSKLIKHQLETPYQLNENIALAKDIHKRRQALKLDKILFE